MIGAFLLRVLINRTDDFSCAPHLQPTTAELTEEKEIIRCLEHTETILLMIVSKIEICRVFRNKLLVT